MNTKTKTTLSIVGIAIGLTLLSIAVTIGLQEHQALASRADALQHAAEQAQTHISESGTQSGSHISE